MRKTFTMCTVAVAVFAASAIASPRAQAMTIGSPVGLSAAIHETDLAQDVAYYGYYPYGYYSPYGGMSVVLGGRGAGGSLVTTGITGRIDIITGRMDITGRIGAMVTDELGLAEKAPARVCELKGAIWHSAQSN